jgi:hypothetical protein
VARQKGYGILALQDSSHLQDDADREVGQVLVWLTAVWLTAVWLPAVWLPAVWLPAVSQLMIMRSPTSRNGACSNKRNHDHLMRLPCSGTGCWYWAANASDSMPRFGDRGQVEPSPTALRQKVSGKIIDVQGLHHQHDGVIGLAVEPGEQGMRKPVSNVLSCGFAFIGSSMMTKLPPRPVSVPPSDADSR